MGEPKNAYFYDFVFFGRVPEPQNQLLLFLETPGDLKCSSLESTPFQSLATRQPINPSPSLLCRIPEFIKT